MVFCPGQHYIWQPTLLSFCVKMLFIGKLKHIDQLFKNNIYTCLSMVGPYVIQCSFGEIYALLVV